tara:strand:- start:1436 stop:2413 length:978 start_codon:yes stop_codon:yes gene_type:complete
MVFLMVLIGGLTRLTDSGLSMVHWRPIMGVIPPLNDSDWLQIFNEYKKSPEYQIVNQFMNIQEFKYIYWWEWFHRFFARFIGLVFIIPLLYFLIKKKIKKKLFINLLLVFCFGIFQAVIGWWMVKSGLELNPYVSSYRLAFHLTNAVIILTILFWISLNSLSNHDINFIPSKSLEIVSFILIALIYLTIISGAFMAGSNAGQSFNTYPLMNGSIIPEGYFIDDYSYKNLFENTIAINFNHRWLATFTFILIIFFAAYLYFSKIFNKYRAGIILILIFACLQFILGILTLLTNVKITFASLHQINSMLLLISFIYFYHSIKKERIF